MHAIIIPYGHKRAVDHFIADIMAQKLPWRFYKDKYKKGEKEMAQYMETRVNYCPLGAYDIVFPKEFKDMVLTTLGFHKPDYYKLGFFTNAMLRKIYRCKKAKFTPTDKEFLWIKDGVNIICIGIREDGEQPEENSQWEFERGKGWKHEAM